MAKRTVRDLTVRGKRVFIRADLNVPLDAQQAITDDLRIRVEAPMTVGAPLERTVAHAGHFGLYALMLLVAAVAEGLDILVRPGDIIVAGEDGADRGVCFFNIESAVL